MAAQSASTLLGLRLMMTVLPMVVLVAALVLFRRKFTLSDDHAAEISAQLHGKKRVSDMTELHWRAATDAGSYDGTALISVGRGLCICAPTCLPERWKMLWRRCPGRWPRMKNLHERLPDLDRMPGTAQLGPPARHRPHSEISAGQIRL